MRIGGNFFEDLGPGQLLPNPVPRTITEGDVALYIALTGDRNPLYCSDTFAQSLGFERAPVANMLVFHIVFGRAVGEISLNSPGNLGYADLRFSHSFFHKYIQLEAAARSQKKGLWQNVTRDQLPAWLQREKTNLLTEK